MIKGVHAIFYSQDPEADRAFFRDILAWPFVDAHDGWLIFAQPPSELAVHPISGAEHHELYIMCDRIEETVSELKDKGVEFSTSIRDETFGRLTYLCLPGGGKLGLYEPKHASPLKAFGNKPSEVPTHTRGD
jgi:hypothetical protein